MPEVEDVRTIKVGVYREMLEIIKLLDEAWIYKKVHLIKQALDRARIILIELRRSE